MRKIQREILTVSCFKRDQNTLSLLLKYLTLGKQFLYFLGELAYTKGSCLKSFEKLAVRGLLHLEFSAIAPCFKSDKALLLVF